jgi:hypothetical protein
MFTIASIFVSEVASKSYTQIHVLLKPEPCGLWYYNTTTLDQTGTAGKKIVQDTLEARAYASDWYSNSSTSLSSPSLYPVNNLPYSINANTSCPFDQSRCALGATSGFSMETELLDSHSMFGINAPPSDRVQLQKTVTCTVVHVADLVKNETDSIYLDYYLGPTSRKNSTYSYAEITQYTNAGYSIQ